MTVKRLGGSLLITEADGAPVGTVGRLVLPNDSVTLSGSTATIRSAPTGFIGAKAYNSTTQTINNVTVALSLDSEEWDTDGFHSIASNTERMTIPAGLGGKYLIEWRTHASEMDTTSPQWVGWLRKNGSSTVRGSAFGFNYASTDNIPTTDGGTSVVVDLVAGDYIDIQMFALSSTAFGHATGEYATSLTIVKLDSGKVGQGIGAKAYATATQTLSNNVASVITLDSEEFDTDGFHSTSVNTGRMTIPAGLAGKYLLTGGGLFASSSTGLEYGFRVNGATPVRSWEGTDASGGQFIQTIAVADLAAGDYVTFEVYHNSGSSRTFGHATAVDAQASFVIARLDSGGSGSGASSGVTVTDTDGTPSSAVSTLVFPSDSVTIAGSTATIRGVPTGFIGCQAVKSASQALANGTWTSITFPSSESWDTDSFHSLVTNSDRFTIPAGLSGKYLVIARVSWAANANSPRYLRWAKNGSQIQGNMPQWTPTSGDDNTGLSTTMLDLAAGDYITIEAYQGSGGSLNVNGGQFELVKLDSGKVGQGIGVRATNTAGTSIVTATATAVPFATEDFDTDGFHDIATNNTRLTVPVGLGGKYLISGQLTFTSTVSNSEYAVIMKNGSSVMAFQGRFDATGNANGVNLSTVLDLASGDYVELVVNQSTGTSKTLEATPGYNWLTMIRLDSGSAGAGTVVVTDTDGSPSQSVGTIVFPSDSVSISGTTATVRQVPQGFIGAKARRTSTQSIPDSAFTAIQFSDPDDFDTDTFHDTVTNNTRVTVPSGLSGKYLVVSHIDWGENNGSGVRYTLIYRNGIEVQGEHDNPVTAGGGTNFARTVSAILDLVAGDYIESFVYQNSGGSRTAIGSLSMTKLDSGKVGQGIGAVVRKSTDTTLTTATPLAPTFDVEDKDTDNFHSVVANQSRMTIPAGLGGSYLLMASAEFEGAASGEYISYFQKNADGIARGLHRHTPASTQDFAYSMSVPIDLAVGDYVEVYHQQSSGVNRTLRARTSAGPMFGIMRLDSGGSGAGTVVITDTDGSPSSSVGTIVFPSDSVSISGSTATVRQVPQGFIGCGLTNSTDIAITTGAEAALNFNTDIWDTDNFHDTASNTNRLTVPPGLGGKYLLNIHARFSANPGRCYLIGRRQTANLISLMVPAVSTGSDFLAIGSTVLDLVAGDYVELKYLTTNNVNIEATTVDYGPVVTFTKIDSGKVGQGIGVSVYHNTTQTVNVSVIPMNSQLWDTDGFHSLVTNTDRLTIPPGLGGKYLVWYSAGDSSAAAAAGEYCRVLKNGATTVSGNIPTGSGGYGMAGAVVLDLLAGDYLSVFFTGNRTLGHASAYEAQSSFGLARLDSGSPGAGTVVVAESDGSPSQSVGTIVFPSDSVSISGTTATVRQVPRAFIGCKLFNSTTQSVVTGTYPVVLSWDSEDFDTDGFHSTSANTSRITIPAGMSGKYLVEGGANFGSNTSGERLMYVLKNGTQGRGLFQRISANNTFDTEMAVAGVLDLTAGDYLELGVYQTSGGTRTIGTGSVFGVTKLDSGKVGGAIGAKAIRTATQALTANTDTVVLFNAADDFDTDGFHDTVTNSGRMTVPAGLSGKYECVANVAFASSGTYRYIQFKKNGGVLAMPLAEWTADSTFTNGGTLSSVFDLVAGDYIEVNVAVGASINITGAQFSFMRLDSGTGVPDWQSYTPTLTGSGSNPTLGTGSAQVGRYQQTGKTVVGRAEITFGSSGVVAGSGQYIISLPVAATSTPTVQRVYGTAVMYDSSATLFFTGVVYQGPTSSNVRIAINNNSTLVANTGTLFTEAANDQIWIEFSYEAA